MMVCLWVSRWMLSAAEAARNSLPTWGNSSVTAFFADFALPWAALDSLWTAVLQIGQGFSGSCRQGRGRHQRAKGKHSKPRGGVIKLFHVFISLLCQDWKEGGFTLEKTNVEIRSPETCCPVLGSCRTGTIGSIGYPSPPCAGVLVL